MLKTLDSTHPVVGEGATLIGYSDRQAYTVIAVHGSTRVTLQRDKVTLLNPVGSGEPDALRFSPGGFVGHTSGVQRYSYEQDPDGVIEKATLRKDGSWRLARENARVLIGQRSEHYDFNF